MQVVDDSTSNTITSYSSLDKVFRERGCGAKLKNVTFFAEQLLKKMKDRKINNIVFDKKGFRYAGIVTQLVSELRKGGILF